MPFSAVQTKTAISAVSGTAIACTFDTPPTEGNFILAVVMHTGASVLPDSSYGPYGIAVGNINILYHFYKMVDTGESSTFSVTSPASVTWAVCLCEYTADADTQNDAVVVDANKAVASSYTLATTNAVIADDLAVVSFAQQGGTYRSATSWSGGFTEVADLQPLGTVVAGLAVADQVMVGAVNANCTVTLSGSTSTKPSMIVQQFFAQAKEGRQRSTQQAASGMW